MDIYIIISSVLGLAIGSVSVFFLKKNNNKSSDVETSNESADNQKSTPKESLDTQKIKQTNLKLTAEKIKLNEKLKELEEHIENSISLDAQKFQQANLKLTAEKIKLQEKLKELEEPNQNSISADAKKIKKLKNDIEDLEIDVEDLEIRSKKVKKEKESIQKELDESKDEINELVKETEGLNKETKRQKNEIEEKSKKLEFVNNILSANSNTDFESIIQKVNAIREYVEENIVNLFEDEDYVANEIYSWGVSELKPWIKDKKVIAIVGEFSAGKTSIVNRILSQDDPNIPLLPTNSKETTAIPTYISYGNDFNCQFYSPSQELKNIRQETFEMVTKSVIDKTDISSLIKYFVLSYNNENLKNISILDTPGFASNSDKIIKRTTDVVREADALFWVIDANTGDINQTSIEVMQEHLHEMPIYFILNKSDTKSDKDLKLLEEKIKATAEKNAIPYKEILRFSNEEEIGVLINCINQIDNKETENIIHEISEFLQGSISYYNEDKNDLSKNKNEHQHWIRNIESEFKTINEDVSYSAKKIKELINFNDGGWFGKERYQIESEDYEQVKDIIHNFKVISKAIPQSVKEYEEAVKSDCEIKNDLHDNKYHRNKLEKINKEFRNKVKAYNQNLLD